MDLCNIDGGDVTPGGICGLSSFLPTETGTPSLASAFAAAQSLSLFCVAVGW